MYVNNKELKQQFIYSIKLEPKIKYGVKHYRCLCCGRKVKNGEISCAVKTDLGSPNMCYFLTEDDAKRFADVFAQKYPKFKVHHISKVPTSRLYLNFNIIELNTTCGHAYVDECILSEDVVGITDVICDPSIKTDKFNELAYTMRYEYHKEDSGEVVLGTPVIDTPEHLLELIKKQFEEIKSAILSGEVLDDSVCIHFSQKSSPYYFNVEIGYSYPHLRFVAFTDADADAKFDFAMKVKNVLQRLLDKELKKEIKPEPQEEEGPEYNIPDPEDYDLDI